MILETRFLLTLSLSLIVISFCGVSSSNTVLANHNKKVSIVCADYMPCLNGICIGHACPSANSLQTRTDGSDDLNQLFNVGQPSDIYKLARSSVNSLHNNQNTNNANDCVKSQISKVTILGKRDLNEDFKRASDGDPNTKWSMNDGRASIQMDLGEIKKVCSFNIHWYKGEKGAYTFVISSSIDGVNFTNILKGMSDGSSGASENYPIIKEVQGRYIRLDASRDFQVSGVSDVSVYTKYVKDPNAYANPRQYLVEAHSPSSTHESINQIEPNQYVQLISPLIETNLLQVMPDKNIETATTSTIQINLAGNGTDKDNGLKFSIIDLPLHGVLKQGSIAESIIYEPIDGFKGEDTFTYDAINEHGTETLKGRVNILVGNNSPL
ncbi:MAG TPA: discoidin domain-containing protein [Nitrososphaeraceae archaeon]